MGVFAWRNLLTRPLRTILALVGLSIPILGVLGLFSLSNGLRDLVGDTLEPDRGTDRPERERAQPGLQQRARQPGRRPEDRCRRPAVAPEVWGIAPPIEGRGMLSTGMLSGKSMIRSSTSR